MPAIGLHAAEGCWTSAGGKMSLSGEVHNPLMQLILTGLITLVGLLLALTLSGASPILGFVAAAATVF